MSYQILVWKSLPSCIHSPHVAEDVARRKHACPAAGWGRSGVCTGGL